MPDSTEQEPQCNLWAALGVRGNELPQKIMECSAVANSASRTSSAHQQQENYRCRIAACMAEGRWAGQAVPGAWPKERAGRHRRNLFRSARGALFSVPCRAPATGRTLHRPGRAALAPFPVADHLVRQVCVPRQLHPGWDEPPPDPASVSRHVLRGLGAVLPLLRCDLRLRGGIHWHRLWQHRSAPRAG